MAKPQPLGRIDDLDPYVPGLSIAEIAAKYGLNKIIKLASNENPLGVSPLVKDTLCKSSALAFRYPQSGNPRLVTAIAALHGVNSERVAAGNGSDEIIDLLIRLFAQSEQHNIVCFEPCFSIYPIQARINGNPVKRCPLNPDFTFDFDGLLKEVDENTRLVFITTPDNPSGYCPKAAEVKRFSSALAAKNPHALLVIDEAYMDFARNGKEKSLLENHILPDNAIFLRTFSKSFGLAGIRLGYAIMPEAIAALFWRARLPFSVNLLAEEAGLAAIKDKTFYKLVLDTVAAERVFLENGLEKLGCKVWPSDANFLMFTLPHTFMSAQACHAALLEKGIIIRSLKSYNLPDFLRVSIGNHQENLSFLKALAEILGDAEKCHCQL